VALGSDAGNVQVKLGGTQVLAVASSELVEPYPDRPAEGVLQFFVEFSPMASPSFEPGRPPEAAVELTRLLDRGLRMSQSVDVEALCVVASKHVWAIRCDVTVLDDCGNITDAALFAALIALRHLRLPPLSLSGVGDEATAVVLPTDQGETTPLIFHHTPIAVSLGFFKAAAADAVDQLLCIVDPTDREELVMQGSMTVVLNQHQEVCALHKPGGLPVEGARLLESMRQAAAVAPQRLLTLEAVLQEHAQRMAAAAETLRRTGRQEKKRVKRADTEAGMSPASRPIVASERDPHDVSASTADVALAADAELAVKTATAGGVAAADAQVASDAPSALAAQAASASAKKKKKKKNGAKKRAAESGDEEETTTVHSAFAKLC